MSEKDKCNAIGYKEEAMKIYRVANCNNTSGWWQ
jgi:hypothetical protein